MEELPLVTFALFAYNQEAFIEEAVNGALSQTYRPLEIIFSDDCSTDRTYDIMQSAVARYSGPHRVILNRTPRNRGFGQHINDVVKRAHGELLVFAAGDDVSYPERTTTLVAHWLEGGRSPAMCSGWDGIQDGQVRKGPPPWFLTHARGLRHESSASAMREFVLHGRYGISGCSAAYSPMLFEEFGPLPENLCLEDSVLTLRAMILGGVEILEQSLIGYREHNHNIWGSKSSIARDPTQFAGEVFDLARRAAMHVVAKEAQLSDLTRGAELSRDSTVDWSELKAEIRRSQLACQQLAAWPTLNVWNKVRNLREVRRLPFVWSLGGLRGLLFCLPVGGYARLSHGLRSLRILLQRQASSR